MAGRPYEGVVVVVEKNVMYIFYVLFGITFWLLGARWSCLLAVRASKCELWETLREDGDCRNHFEYDAWPLRRDLSNAFSVICTMLSLCHQPPCLATKNTGRLVKVASSLDALRSRRHGACHSLYAAFRCRYGRKSDKAQTVKNRRGSP